VNALRFVCFANPLLGLPRQFLIARRDDAQSYR
jgi:hypothetical protein